MTKASIVIASYQQSKYWAQLVSALRLSRPLIHEVILVEDGFFSEDYDGECYSSAFRAALGEDMPFQIHERDHTGFGLCRSLNLGCSAATGDLILVMEGDEFFYDNVLEKDLRLAGLDPSILLAGRKTYVTPRTTEIIEPDHRAAVPFNPNRAWWWCSGGHLMFWKSAWERVGGFDEEYGYGLHDFDYAIRHMKTFGIGSVVYGGGTMAHQGSGKGRSDPSPESWRRFNTVLSGLC